MLMIEKLWLFEYCEQDVSKNGDVFYWEYLPFQNLLHSASLTNWSKKWTENRGSVKISTSVWNHWTRTSTYKDAWLSQTLVLWNWNDLIEWFVSMDLKNNKVNKQIKINGHEIFDVDNKIAGLIFSSFSSYADHTPTIAVSHVTANKTIIEITVWDKQISITNFEKWEKGLFDFGIPWVEQSDSIKSIQKVSVWGSILRDFPVRIVTHGWFVFAGKMKYSWNKLVPDKWELTLPNWWKYDGHFNSQGVPEGKWTYYKRTDFGKRKVSWAWKNWKLVYASAVNSAMSKSGVIENKDAYSFDELDRYQNEFLRDDIPWEPYK